MAKSGKWSGRIGKMFPLGGGNATPRLGDALLEAGLISAEQLEAALETQSRKGFRIGYHLVKDGILDESVLGDFLSARYGVPALPEEALQADQNLMQELRIDLLKQHECFPVSRTSNTVTLAISDPSDTEALQALSQALGLQVNPVVAPQSVVRKRLADHMALDAIRKNAAGGADARELTRFFTQLKDYRFQRVLGVGGFGMVCLCWQISLDRPVAIKTLSRGMLRIEGMAERFKREGKIIARLRHPNIVQVYEMGEAYDQLYIVMEFFEGKSLDAYSQGRDLVESLSALAAVCEALDHAASKGIVHRDVKPGNILANENNEVKLLDFGVAFNDETSDSRLTRQNVVLGTPKYMAPECFEGAMATTTRSDIYALALVAYEILTGHEFSKSNPTPAMQANPDLPALLSQTLTAALANNPDKRLPSFDIFKRALLVSRDQLVTGKIGIPTIEEESQADQLPALQAQPTVDATVIDTAADSEEALARCYEETALLVEEGHKHRVAIARHHKMQREMIIKTLPRTTLDLAMLPKWAELKHPHIGQLYGFTRHRSTVTLILEYINGGSLADRMRGGPVSGKDFAHWAEALVQALHQAAQLGIAHGGFHPGNILFTPDGLLKVVDFTISRDIKKRFGRYSRPELRSAWERDQYGLGVIWFEMLTGERFRGAKSLQANFNTLHENKQIEFFLKVPLGRLWGIQRYGPRYKGFSDMLPDLQMVREKT